MNHHRIWLAIVAVTTCGLVSAGSPHAQTPDDLIRLANAACERGDWDEADARYTQAEERTTDPGFVAYNKGIVFFRRGEYRRAELGFRRALGDRAIPQDRRERALYNLGNALVKQANDQDISRLQAAIDCYELVLKESRDNGLRADTAHNLEIAKHLWLQARAKRPVKENDPEWDEPNDPKTPPPDPRKQPDENDGNKSDPSRTPEPGKKIEPGKGNEQGNIPKEVERPTPGKGNLPVIPDTEEVKPLSPEDAAELLKRNGARIQRERQKLRADGVQGERLRATDW